MRFIQIKISFKKREKKRKENLVKLYLVFLENEKTRKKRNNGCRRVEVIKCCFVKSK